MRSAKDEVGSKDHLILVYYRFQFQFVEDLVIILEESRFIRSLPAKLFPWGGVDVVDDLLHLPLVEVSKDRFFRKNHPEQGVGLFHSSFLTGTHRVAVVDGGTDEAVFIDFQGVGITEFGSSVTIMPNSG